MVVDREIWKKRGDVILVKFSSLKTAKRVIFTKQESWRFHEQSITLELFINNLPTYLITGLVRSVSLLVLRFLSYRSYTTPTTTKCSTSTVISSVSLNDWYRGIQETEFKIQEKDKETEETSGTKEVGLYNWLLRVKGRNRAREERGEDRTHLNEYR